MLLFGKKDKPDPYEIVKERWKTSFNFLDKKRFAIQKDDTYESGIEKNKFFLTLKKKNHFAWVLSEPNRYANFCLEGDIEFHPDNKHSAAGFIFRYINEENFYYFLISNKGFFRFDVVFNGNPLVRIDWTESPHISDSTNSIRIIARDTYFSFYVDDEWIAELEDDMLFKGQIGFAAQNYNDKPEAHFYLKEFSLESRDIEIEKHFERWTSYIPQEPEARIRLAKTLYAMEAYTAASIQIKKALRHKKPTADDFFLFGEMCVNMGMHELALETIDKCLSLEPSRTAAIQEKANILYLLNKTIEARDFILGKISLFEDNATIYNLLGNCEYSIGNFEKAFAAYETACSIQDTMPIFMVNTARAADMNGNKEKAIEYYLKASTLFFKEEAFDELYPIFARLEKLDSVNDDVRGLAGKILFQEQKRDEAEEIFDDLIKKGCNDSGIFYLNGLIKKDKGEIKNALKDFKKACELEESFYLYWLRLGEVKYLAGENPEKELEKAMELKPEDPWVLNQYGLYLLNKKDYKEANEYFARALEKASGETDIAIDIAINLSQSHYNLGQMDEAFQVLASEDFEGKSKIYNQRGNLFTQDKKFKKAINEYKKALKIEPENPAYLENCAEACIEVDMIMQAEEYLTKLYDISPTPSVLNLIGYLSLIKREWVRAGVAFQEGLEKDPGNTTIMINLANLYLDRSDYQKSMEWINKVLEKEPENEIAQRIKKNIRNKFEKNLLCATCGREWWVAKTIPPQSLGTIHGEPPGEAPAGKCENCGKIYCIECAQKHLKEKRFVCPDCDKYLKLSDDWLKYLLIEAIKKADVEKADVEKVDVEKVDVEKVDVEKVDVEKVDVEKVDVEKVDVEKADVEKVDAEKADEEKTSVEKS
ncbi:MAG: tetratricopeptide repeat protein [Spirochaetales bacterium]|nr:tetratricopeptide repeat protein [Spirochaetales bacterium]